MISINTKKLLGFFFGTLLTSFNCHSFAAGTGTTTTAIQTNATVSGGCTVSIADFNFGTVQAGKNSPTLNNNLNILCSKGVNSTISFVFPNTLPYMTGQNFGDTLYYDLFSYDTAQDFAYGGTIPLTGNGETISLPIQGYIVKDSTFSSLLVPYVTPDNYTGSAQVQIIY